MYSSPTGFALLPSVDRSFGRLVSSLGAALSSGSDPAEPGREVTLQ